MKIKAIRPGYFVLHQANGYPMPADFAKAFFDYYANQLRIV